MCHDIFVKLGLLEDQLRLVKILFANFTGKMIEVDGLIKLPVELGKEPAIRWVNMEFVVVKLTCAHNIILDRPGLASIGGLKSTGAPMYEALNFERNMDCARGI